MELKGSICGTLANGQVGSQPERQGPWAPLVQTFFLSSHEPPDRVTGFKLHELSDIEMLEPPSTLHLAHCNLSSIIISYTGVKYLFYFVGAH